MTPTLPTPHRHDPRRRALLVVACAATGACVLGRIPNAVAATVDAQQPTLEFEADGVYASSTVVFALPRALEDALRRGVPLYFLTNLDVRRGRWWWFDQRVGSGQLHTRLSYQPLLEKYHVSTGALQRSYAALDEALNQVQHILRVKVADARDLVPGQTYQVTGRFELDLSQLPRPFQINVGSSTDWQLEADFPAASFTWKPPPSTASPG